MRKKQDIRDWLEEHRDEIVSGELVVMFEDECHVLWGDVCGYVWGKANERVEVPMTNERHKQTYYGAVNLQTQQCHIQTQPSGNSEGTIAFLQSLMTQYPERRLALIWDGASYHRSQAVKDFLAAVNQGLEESQWQVTCLRFAPNDPTQNPIEDIWLSAKRFVREYYHLCSSFPVVRLLFELATQKQIFDFPKLFAYGKFS